MHEKTKKTLDTLLKKADSPRERFMVAALNGGVVVAATKDDVMHLSECRVAVGEAENEVPFDEAKLIERTPVTNAPLVLAYDEDGMRVWRDFFVENGARKDGGVLYLPLSADAAENFYGLVDDSDMVEKEVCAVTQETFVDSEGTVTARITPEEFSWELKANFTCEGFLNALVEAMAKEEEHGKQAFPA